MSFLDRNADNKLRLRRNAQRLRKDGVAIDVDPPLSSAGGPVSLELSPSGALEVVSSQLAVAVDGVSMTINGSNQLANGYTFQGVIGTGGITVNTIGPFVTFSVNTGPGIKVATNQIQAVVDGSSVTINGSNQLVATPTGSGSGLTSLPLSAADTSITVGGSGLTVKAGLATNGGLAVSSGLLVNGFQILSSDPGSPTVGQGWFNSTINVYKADLGMVSSFVAGVWTGVNSSVISNSSTLTNFTPSVSVPAGVWNLAGRTIRVTAIIGGSGVSGTYTPSLKMGTTTIWTGPTLSGTAFTSLWIDLLITTTTTGTSGQVLVLGRVFNSATVMTSANALTTINLTTAQTLQWAGQFSVASASNAAQMSYWAFELIA